MRGGPSRRRFSMACRLSGPGASPCRLPLPPLKTAQALDNLDPTSSAFRKCLRELRSICGTRAILPTSHTLSPSHLNVGPHPIASGGPGDVYEGTFKGSEVCIKRIRVYSKDGPGKATKVHYRRHHSPGLPLLTRLTDPLPGGCRVEAFGTPEYCSIPRHYFYSSPTCLNVDARRGSHGAHHEVPQRRPTWTCKCQFCLA